MLCVIHIMKPAFSFFEVDFVLTLFFDLSIATSARRFSSSLYMTVKALFPNTFAALASPLTRCPFNLASCFNLPSFSASCAWALGLLGRCIVKIMAARRAHRGKKKRMYFDVELELKEIYLTSASTLPPPLVRG